MSDLGWYGRSSYDRKQNERLDTLSGELSRQRDEARRLRAALSKAQGNLEQRVSRLATAFDAFVELSDLREELRAFEPAAEARRRARQVLSQLVAAGGRVDQLPLSLSPSPAADPGTEAPGYWLPHALTGLVALLQDDPTAAEAALAAARDCDATRTELFLCLALVLGGHVDQAAGRLPAVLELQADRAIGRAQRALWLAAADGRFGDRGRAVLVDRLAALVAGLPDGTRATQVLAWQDVVEALPRGRPPLPALPKPIEAPGGLVAPIRAADQLASFADWYAEAAEGLVTASSASTASSAQQPVAADSDPPDPLAGLLRDLVDEGAPDEQPLLQRMTELRRVLQADGAEPSPSPAPWYESVDTPLALLLADATSGNLGRRAVASRAATPLLATVADELAAVARQSAPEHAHVRIGRHSVRFGPTGADPVSVTAAEAATFAAPRAPGDGATRTARETRIGRGLLLSAPVAAVVGIVMGVAPLGLVAGFGLGGVGAWLAYDAVQNRKAAEAAVERRANEWARLRQQIEQVGSALASLRDQARRAAEDASGTRTRLDELFAVADRYVAECGAMVSTTLPMARPSAT